MAAAGSRALSGLCGIPGTAYSVQSRFMAAASKAALGLHRSVANSGLLLWGVEDSTPQSEKWIWFTLGSRSRCVAALWTPRLRTYVADLRSSRFAATNGGRPPVVPGDGRSSLHRCSAA